MSARDEYCRTAWPRMVALYGIAGIGALCLSLQDEWNADVPYLLFLVLAEAAGEGAEPADADRLREAAEAWRTLAVLPLRRLRVALKERATTPELQAFRASIKAAELEAERLQVLRLAEHFAPMAGPPDLAASYLASLGVPLPRSDATLAALRDGARRVTSPSCPS